MPLTDCWFWDGTRCCWWYLLCYYWRENTSEMDCSWGLDFAQNIEVNLDVALTQAIYHKKYSTQSDVWSFGCVMYEVWSLGHKPFEDSSGKQVNKNDLLKMAIANHTIHVVCTKNHNRIQTLTTSWLSKSYIWTDDPVLVSLMVL